MMFGLYVTNIILDEFDSPWNTQFNPKASFYQLLCESFESCSEFQKSHLESISYLE